MFEPAKASDPDLAKKAVDTIKFLAIDAVEKANSGHPGLPMGAADYAFVLWSRFLKFDPKDPHWADRDRFVLSPGHGSALLYALLHLAGYDLSMDELKSFRQWGSKTPGHPESHLTPGVEVTTTRAPDLIGQRPGFLGDCFMEFGAVVDESDAIVRGITIGQRALSHQSVDERPPARLGVVVRAGGVLPGLRHICDFHVVDMGRGSRAASRHERSARRTKRL